MRCFVDSNVIISAGIFPNSVPADALRKAVSMPNTTIVSDYALDEVHRVINKKFPSKVGDFETFLYRLMFDVELVFTPGDSVADEPNLRDINDQPILRAALAANADVLITGDRDLLESGISSPQVVTPAKFLEISENSH